jgi:hypothetical protein
MSEEKSTRDSLANGEYRPATVIVTPAKAPQTTTPPENERVVSSSRLSTMNVRITTRPTKVNHPTD